MRLLINENIIKNKWFHRSHTPITKWDEKKQRSGYYLGLYLYSDLSIGASFGKYIYEFDLTNAKLYNEHDIEKNKSKLISIANKLNLIVSNGSGWWISKTLRHLGYDGILRGSVEAVLFDPEKFFEKEIKPNEKDN